MSGLLRDTLEDIARVATAHLEAVGLGDKVKLPLMVVLGGRTSQCQHDPRREEPRDTW
jgi:hypothetical protein